MRCFRRVPPPAFADNKYQMHFKKSAVATLLLACALIANAAPSADTGREAARLLERAKRAAGGTAWDSIKNIRTFFTHTEEGNSHAGDEIVDLPGERLTLSIDTPDGKRYGVNTQQMWLTYFDRASTANTSARAISDLYNEAYGYWFKRHPAQFSVRARKQAYQGARYAIVRVTPDKGTALDYWINEKTFLIERLQYLDGEGNIAQSADMSDFSRVGRLLLPFHAILRTAAAGESREEEDIAISVIINAPVSDAPFAPPLPEQVRGFLPGQREVQIPFELRQNHIAINVMLNGYGPFHFILDTGCNNTMTPAVMHAAQLEQSEMIGLYGFGNGTSQAHLVRVQSTGLGSLSLRGQTFITSDIPQDSGIDGMLGYEWLQRLPIKIDYAQRVLTLYNPEGFQYEGSAAPIALHFVDQFDRHGKIFYPAPRIDAAIDGIPGVFDIDTGDFEAILVRNEFARQHQLLRHYAVIGLSSSEDINGSVLSKLITRATAFQIGSHYVPNKLLTIAPMQQQGILADSGLAGNIGYEVLREFSVTLDYPRRAMYLEPNNGAAALDYCGPLCADWLPPP